MRRYLGILADRSVSGRRFYEQTDFIAGLLKAARELGVPAYAFGPGDADPRTRRVRGWTRSGGRWVAGTYPWPALVYNRFFLHTPGAAGRAVLRRYRALMRRDRLRLLENRLPDKAALHKILSRHPELAEHVPPTQPCRTMADLTGALARWRRVVVKPARGGKGVGIWFVRPLGRERYLVRRGSGRGGTQLDRTELAAWLERRRRAGRHLVQAWLDLRVFEGRPVDLRVLVQRDGRGRLCVTGGAARVGARGRLVSNLHRGGDALPLERVLAPYGHAERDALALAMRVATVLDARYGPIAEVGIDLALDTEGRLWVMEANSRPGRMIFRKLGDRHRRRLAVMRPIAYAAYLLAGNRPVPADASATASDCSDDV